MLEKDYGTIREKQVRDVAARLGVADFVYFALPTSKGKAQREAAGDGLLLVGEHGAILQVKTREPAIGLTDSVERARAWVKKNAEKAVKQGLGTKRELSRRKEMGTPIVAFPVRALNLSEQARERYKCYISYDTRDWPVIVILDHPQMPDIDLGFTPGVVYFGFNDWSELQRRLRSTFATINYVHRILRDNLHVPLWQEASRYIAVYGADEASANDSVTTFPYLAHPDHLDELGTDIFHDIIDKVWPDDGDIPWKSVEEYRAIVEFLDTVPPQLQSVVGRWILRKRSEITNGQRVSSGLIQLELKHRLIFACSHLEHWSDGHEWFREFMFLTSLRHIQAIESGAVENTKTLGVAALVEDRGEKIGMSYSFFMVSGHESYVDIPKDLRRNFEWRYGIHNHQTATTLEMQVEPKELCPCMSGKEFMICCGNV